MRLLDVTLAPASAGAITTVDVSGTTNVVIMVWGRYPAASDPRVDIIGSVPDGCAVTVYSMYEGLLDLLVQGARPSGDAEGLDLGQYGRAELIGRSTAFHLTAVNDSRFLKSQLAAAVLAETTARQTADGVLTTALTAVNSRVDDEEYARTVGDAGLLAQLTTEVGARAAGDSELALHTSRISTFSGGLFLLRPNATAHDISKIKDRFRLICHRTAGGGPDYVVEAILDYTWSATYADAATCGWTLGSTVVPMADSMIRLIEGIWGIAENAEWPFPSLSGMMWTHEGMYPCTLAKMAEVWPSGPVFFSTAPATTRVAHGKILFHIPGKP